ncbi:hypothetical protein [Collimonas silvisoli]|nr:hypothetical protein [Collimonas silvisoli]
MLIIAGSIIFVAAAVIGLALWRLIYLTGQLVPACNDDFIFF